jgi:hypothetical protein
MPLIKAGTGRSTQSNSFLAGVEAAEKAMKGIYGTPDAMLVFASPAYDHESLLEGIASVAENIPMAGGTTAGEISSEGFSENSVVTLAVQSDTLRFVTAVAEGMRDDEYACALSFVHTVQDKCHAGPALSLFVFPDGMGGDGVRVIEGMQAGMRKPIEIVGGFLGDNDRFSHTYQYCNGKVYQNAITGMLICVPLSIDIRTGIGMGSGFASIGNSMYCTSSEGNVIKEIDHEPALDVYMDLLGEERSNRLPEICLEYPFGLIDSQSIASRPPYFQIRCGLSVDYERKSITVAGSVPQGSAMTLTSGSRGDLINGARMAAERAKDCLKGYKPELIVVFSCVGRKIVLGRRVEEEVDAVKDVLGADVPTIGFYTYGEIGPVDKLTEDLSAVRFHNETMVVWVVGSPGI